VITLLKFGEWLLQHRLAKQFTQEEAAKRAGMTRVMWAKLESNSSGTRRENIPRIAAAVEANLEETYRLAGYVPLVAQTDGEFAQQLAQEIASQISRIPPNKREQYKIKIRSDVQSLASLLIDAAT
jgi:transcriptional regulator with XRE-family HTH domain